MGYRILVVDDSPIIRSIVKKSVRMSGIETEELLEAANGREALALLGERTADIVIADLNMPEMNGVEMIGEMAKDQRLAPIPVIVVSSDRNHDRMEALKRHGVSAFLKKPFRPEELRGVLVDALSRVGPSSEAPPPAISGAAMRGALAATLEKAAFVLVDPVSEPSPWSGLLVEAQFPFDGPVKGRLALATSPSFAMELAGNLLGVDPESVAASKGAHDAVGELLNIFAGVLFEDCFGPECNCSMGLPQLRTMTATAQETERAEASCVVTLLDESGHRVDAEAFID